jgi:hypothetical protein
MGPMSLLAIKRGELFYPYDGPFCFAEVNSDRVYWKLSESGAMEKVYVNKYRSVLQIKSTHTTYT